MKRNKKVSEDLVNKEGYDPTPLLTRPKHIAIVALGISMQAFLQEHMSMPGMKSPFDEVWTLNRGVRGVQHDKLFVMDDIAWLEEKDPYYTNFLKNHDRPIITSFEYSDYPMTIPYPLYEVLDTIKDDVFTVNTVSYMLAYGIHIGVEKFSIYGADFIYANGNTAEKGGQAVAYLLGMGSQFGFTHRIPQSSTLLYANEAKLQPNGTVARVPYGYHRRQMMEERDAKNKQIKADRKKRLK
jgi:hypothetical protein